jgi:hypothetical protein
MSTSGAGLHWVSPFSPWSHILATEREAALARWEALFAQSDARIKKESQSDAEAKKAKTQ